jgi:hypothetical protein
MLYLVWLESCCACHDPWGTGRSFMVGGL